MLLPRIGALIAAIALASAPPAGWSAQAQPAIAATKAPHSRFVPLDGGQNFRDLGGYRTSNGRTVKWGMVYRSATMHRLTPADFQTLKARGVRTIVDLRASDERARDRFSPGGGFTPRVLARDYDMGTSQLTRAMRDFTSMTPATARTAFAESYAVIPFEFAGQYRQMFAQLLAGKAPLIVNCSAGKDRTGIASALILTALGVPRATIVEDYLLSNPSAQPVRATPMPASNDPRSRGVAPEVMAILAGVEAPFLEAAFRAIESRPGGMNAYFRNRLGVGPAEMRRLKALYLQ